MVNVELIKALRWCGDENNEWCVLEEYKCPLWNEDRMIDECKEELMRAAADALEAAGRQIARLEEDLKTREAEREVLQDTIKICEEAADRCRAQLQAAHYYNKLAKRLREKTISFKAWKPFRPGELPTDGILLDEEKRLTANLYEHKVPFIHPCSICGQWHTCPNAYTTDAELCKEHEDMR